MVVKKSNVKLIELHLDEVNMTIVKYKNSTSIKAIQSRMGELNNPTCSFDFTCREEIVKYN